MKQLMMQWVDQILLVFCNQFVTSLLFLLTWLSLHQVYNNQWSVQHLAPFITNTVIEYFFAKYHLPAANLSCGRPFLSRFKEQAWNKFITNNCLVAKMATSLTHIYHFILLTLLSVHVCMLGGGGGGGCFLKNNLCFFFLLGGEKNF